MYVPEEARLRMNMKFNGLNETVCIYGMIRATIKRFVLLEYNVQLVFNSCRELRIFDFEINLIFVPEPNFKSSLMIGYS